MNKVCDYVSFLPDFSDSSIKKLGDIKQAMETLAKYDLEDRDVLDAVKRELRRRLIKNKVRTRNKIKVCIRHYA